MFVTKKDRVFSFNFSIFLNKVKMDDLEIFLYLNLDFIHYFFSNFSLYSVFFTFLFLQKNLWPEKINWEYYCQFCSRIYLQIFDNHNTFQEIIVDEQDFTREFKNFFRKNLFFSVVICHDHARFIDSKKS